MSSVNDQLVQQLALVSQQIEEHRTAIWLLEDRRNTLRLQLKAAGFTAPEPAAAEVPA